jgi:hypothetical protein
VMMMAVVAAVHDLVDRVGCYLELGIGALKRREFLRDLRKPLIELRSGPCIQRGEGTDDAGLALGEDQAWRRDDEHGRADDGQSKAIAQYVRDGH